MSHDVADPYEPDLLGFAATLTDDRALVQHLVSQALAHVADDPSTTDPAAAARVWTVRGLLSDGYRLGSPVAPDVDTASEIEPASDAEDHVGDRLEARLARSSRLQRAVVALYYARHSDAATIARIVGSSEGEIDAYLAGVRHRLGIDGSSELHGTAADAEQSLRRLLQNRSAAEVERAAAGKKAEYADTAAELTRERAVGAERESARASQLQTIQSRLDEHAEQARLGGEERLTETARTDALVDDLRQRLEDAVAAREELTSLLQQRQATIAELTRERDQAAARETASAASLETLRARLDENVEQTRRTDEERLAETARTGALVDDLRQRLDDAIAVGERPSELDEQQQRALVELTRERDLAAAREGASVAQLENLQAQLDQQAEQARRSTEERLAETARADAFIVDQKQRLDAALAALEQGVEHDEQRQQAVADLTRERDLAEARENAVTTQLEDLQTQLAEHTEQARLAAEERQTETARADALIEDLRQRLDAAVAAGEQTGELDEQRRQAVADLTRERDLAEARENAVTTQLEDLQTQLAEHTEQARLAAEERQTETARADALIEDLRVQLDTARAADPGVEPAPRATRPATFVAAQPFAFTAVGPVRTHESGSGAAAETPVDGDTTDDEVTTASPN